MPDELPFLTADDILAADDIKMEAVPVPEWGGKVRVRGFDVRTANDLRRQATIKNPRTNEERVDNDRLEALMFCAGVVDGKGEPLFTMAQYPQIQKKAAKPFNAVLAAVLAASGIGEAAAQAAAKSAPDASDPAAADARGA